MDERLQRIADRNGIFTSTDLHNAGFSRADIQTLLRNCLIKRIRDSAFKVDNEIPTRMQELAAIQAVAPGCVVSHSDAAHIWDFPYNFDIGRIEISVQRPGNIRMKDVWCHQTRHHPDDIVMHNGLRVTSPARTLFDMSFVLSVGQLARNYQDLQLRKMIKFEEMRRVCGSLGPAKWRRTSRTNKVIEEQAIGGGETQSHEERLFYTTVTQAQLPEPTAQYPVLTDIGLLHVDFAYPIPKIAMEVDVHPSHFTPEGIQRDKERTAALERVGWHVLRFQSGDALTIINEVSEALTRFSANKLLSVV